MGMACSTCVASKHFTQPLLAANRLVLFGASTISNNVANLVAGFWSREISSSKWK
jgi:hypothetical protein